MGMTTMRMFSRKEAPGLTFVFSLAGEASGPEDFRDEALCTMWVPTKEKILGTHGLLYLPTGRPAERLIYKRTGGAFMFRELKDACVSHANAFLRPDTVYELCLALPMNLSDAHLVESGDLWRVGYVALPTFDRRKARQGMRPRFGYYLLAKRVAGSHLNLTLPAKATEKMRFLGADRNKWVDRFRKSA